MSAPDAQQSSGRSDVRPRLAIIVIVVWLLVQMSRIMAFHIVQDVHAGIDSPAWLFPALMDIFLGITAPFVAFALWRKTGLAVWTGAIVWLTLSISDHIDGFTAALTVPLAHSISANNSSPFSTIVLVLAALDVVAVVLLMRRKMKSYYLS